MPAAVGHDGAITPRVFIVVLSVSLCAGNALRAAPDNLAQLRAQLAVAQEAEDKPAVTELSRRIVALVPNDSKVWETLAQAQLDAEDYDRCAQSLDAWEKAVRPAPAAIEDFRGDIFFERKDYKEAEKHWLAFLARKPTTEDAANVYDKLSDLCVDQERWTDNAAYRAKAVAAKDSATRRVARATALLRLHQWDAAYAEMAKANKIDSTDSDVKEWLPQFERLQSFLPQIKALDARLAKSPNDAAILLERARLFTLAERPLLALDDCVRALKLQPASMRARIQAGEAFLDDKRPDDAAKLQVGSNLFRGQGGQVSEYALRTLGEQDAKIAQKADEAATLAKRADTLRDLHQYALALADAQAALALDDKSAAAHFEAAHCFDELSQAKEALAHAVRATELDPKDATAWSFRGVLEAQRADFPAAIESQTRSLAIKESLFALHEREKAARRIGKIDKADADRKRIRELDPTEQ